MGMTNIIHGKIRFLSYMSNDNNIYGPKSSQLHEL